MIQNYRSPIDLQGWWPYYEPVTDTPVEADLVQAVLQDGIAAYRAGDPQALTWLTSGDAEQPFGFLWCVETFNALTRSDINPVWLREKLLKEARV